jgi:DNA-binding XRE family transcriptional regulator
MEKMEIKDIIRNARKKKGLTQRGLAELLKIPYQQVQLWEYGKYKPGFDNISKLCKILDLDIEDIFSPQNEVTTNFNISKPK